MIRLLIPMMAALSLLGIVAAQETDDPRFGTEGEQHILELSDWLEQNPLADDRSEVFEEVFTWWVEAPQLALDWCPALLQDGAKEKTTMLVATQAVVGAGAFLIRNRDETDVMGISLAGVESGLKAYERMIAADGSYRDPVYDRLLERRSDGELRHYVTDKLRECQGGASDERRRSVT
jgi:hypothetical protein